MDLGRLIVRFGFRNAGRARALGGLTVLAVAITLVAFVLLRTLSAGWTDRIEQTPNDRVVTRHKIGWASSLPVHYANPVRQLPGVIRAVGASMVGLKVPGDDGLFATAFGASGRGARRRQRRHSASRWWCLSLPPRRCYRAGCGARCRGRPMAPACS